MATSSTYEVTGMTCEHCEQAIRREVGQLEGVESVDVNAQTGRLVVHMGKTVADADVLAAVDEAGYSATRV